jgi:hypothetical protein
MSFELSKNVEIVPKKICEICALSRVVDFFHVSIRIESQRKRRFEPIGAGFEVKYNLRTVSL